MPTIQGIETSSPPAIDLSEHLYHQIAYTLMRLLPPPLDASAKALRARNHTAIAKVAARLPVGAREIDSRRALHRRAGPGRGDAAAGAGECG